MSQTVASMAEGGSASPKARLAGSFSSGVIEIALFHPFDTIAKRLMSNEGTIVESGKTMANMNKCIFKSKAEAGALAKFGSLYPGVGFATAYKVLQRTYKFGGQPFMRELLDKHYGDAFRKTFGPKKGKSLMHATAGSLIGIGEIALLPLDVLKIKCQTNPDALSGKGLSEFLKEGRKLYSGAGWTAMRNAPGSFALFGGASVAYEWIFKLQNYKDATFWQTFVASICGSTSSLLVSQPLDVIKTRIQSASFGSEVSGMKIVKDLMVNEGVGGFFKGFIPKILVVGPKLVFSFTIAQYLIASYSKYM